MTELPFQRERPDASVAPPLSLRELRFFDAILDARSPSEFAEDHLPGAINVPVLDDDERALVGTIYKQSSSFEAKKIGAALVSANIARHLRERFADRPRTWRPLVYCWRGGGRSAALAHVLAQIGWRVGVLEGGYKAYRRAVVADLETLPSRISWRVVCGMTGSGKSRLLRALSAKGAQVLDLEALAAHRGSVLGNVPDEPQPPQKMFDSLVWSALTHFDPARPVFVEAESKKIGRLHVPDALIEAMWASTCIVLEAPVAVRVELLKEEYVHFLTEPALFASQLQCLTPLHGHDKIRRWQSMTPHANANTLVEELLVQHYDPAYTRSMARHYPQLERASRHLLTEASDSGFEALAAALVDETRAGAS